MCVFVLAPLSVCQPNPTQHIQPLSHSVLYHVGPLSTCLESKSPLNLSALHWILVYNTGLGYQRTTMVPANICLHSSNV
jgi:hypothetical protein